MPVHARQALQDRARHGVTEGSQCFLPALQGERHGIEQGALDVENDRGGARPLHSRRATQDLLVLNINLGSVMQAGRWKSNRMPMRSDVNVMAARGGIEPKDSATEAMSTGAANDREPQVPLEYREVFASIRWGMSWRIAISTSMASGPGRVAARLERLQD